MLDARAVACNCLNSNLTIWNFPPDTCRNIADLARTKNPSDAESTASIGTSDDERLTIRQIAPLSWLLTIPHLVVTVVQNHRHRQRNRLGTGQGPCHPAMAVTVQRYLSINLTRVLSSHQMTQSIGLSIAPSNTRHEVTSHLLEVHHRNTNLTLLNMWILRLITGPIPSIHG
jgi:hypothetical protein